MQIGKFFQFVFLSFFSLISCLCVSFQSYLIHSIFARNPNNNNDMSKKRPHVYPIVHCHGRYFTNVTVIPTIATIMCSSLFIAVAAGRIVQLPSASSYSTETANINNIRNSSMTFLILNIRQRAIMAHSS